MAEVKVIESKTLRIMLSESWTLVAITDGEDIILGLHWGCKPSPTHDVSITGEDAVKFREFFNGI